MTKETTKGWEERFEEDFLNPDKFSSNGLLNPKYEKGRLGYMIEDIKSFIRKLLTSQEAEIRERVIGLRNVCEWCKERDECEHYYPFYNQALDDVLSLLSPKEHKH